MRKTVTVKAVSKKDKYKETVKEILVTLLIVFALIAMGVVANY